MAIKLTIYGQNFTTDTVEEAVALSQRLAVTVTVATKMPAELLNPATLLPRPYRRWAADLTAREQKVATWLAVSFPAPTVNKNLMSVLSLSQGQVQSMIYALRKRGMKFGLARQAVVTRKLNREQGGTESLYGLTELAHIAIMKQYPKLEAKP